MVFRDPGSKGEHRKPRADVQVIGEDRRRGERDSESESEREKTERHREQGSGGEASARVKSANERHRESAREIEKGQCRGTSLIRPPPPRTTIGP